MAQAPVKKTKAQKFSELDKVRDYLAKYKSVYFIENTDIPNPSIQKLREGINGRTLVIKKTMFQKFYPQVDLKENYFMIFTNDDAGEELRRFRYPSYLKEGERIPETVVIKSGILRKEKLAEYLEKTEKNGSNTILLEDFTVCNEGDLCTEAQATILKILGHKFGESSLNIIDIRNSSELKEIKSE